MIIGVGTDLARVARFEAGMVRHGPRFARRLLSDAEFDHFNGHAQPAAYLAKRFAAKEAFVKALGLGLRRGMRWSHIQVVNDALGRPSLVLVDKAHALAQAAGVRAIHLSLSDEAELALAMVVLEG